MRFSTALNVTLLALIALGGAYYWSEVKVIAVQAHNELLPCDTPITYSIESIDPRFGVSTSTVLSALTAASDIWDTAAKRTLFEEVPSGGLVEIRLVYDRRQETSQTLSGLSSGLDTKAAAYDSAKVQYEHDLADYEAKKGSFDTAYAAYDAARSAYEASVAHWNARGGAPQDVYDQLQAQKAQLDQEAVQVRSLESAVNAAADKVNGEVDNLNALAKDLNLDVAQYNKVGAGEPSEFQEAVFESAPGHEEIDVYEFDSAARLRRVLAHELGHALGLEHVDDPRAIMYALNQSSNETPTKADVAELARVCRW